MPIKFHCPSCAAAIKAPETHVGQTLPCPKCGQPVVVVAEPAAPAPSPAPHPPAFPEVAEPEPVADVPEIVTRDSRTYSPPPPVSMEPPATDAFAAPQTRSDRTLDANFQDIRIVDLNLPFRSVMKFAVQFFLCNMLLIGIVWGVMFVLLLIFAAIFGSVSFAP